MQTIQNDDYDETASHPGYSIGSRPANYNIQDKRLFVQSPDTTVDANGDCDIVRYTDHLREGKICYPHDQAYMNYCVKVESMGR